MANVDFRAQLERQLNFIRRSAESFDRGYADEAIRIAVPLRVLFHHTNSSKSLLTQMGLENIELVSTCLVDPPEGTVFFDGLGLVFAGTSGAGVKPKLDQGPGYRLMPLDRWWRQIVCVDNRVKITRRDIALTAANKDGGAHVDPKLTPEYEGLQAGIWSIFNPDNRVEGAVDHEARIPNTHFGYLRQMAFEVLKSPSILQIIATP